MRLHSLLLLSALASLPQFPYSSAEYGFVMTVPAGFLGEGDDPLRANRDIACFVKTSTGNEPWVRLCVEKTGSGIPSRAQKLKFAWKGLDLAGATFRSEWRSGSVDIVAVNVPLRKEPVWLVAMTPAGSGSLAQAALVSTLTTLQGETGQLSSTERAERAGESFGTVGVIIMAVGVGMWIMKRRMRKQSGG